MSGWQRPEAAFDPNHAPTAGPPMIRFSHHGIDTAGYPVKRKTAQQKRTAERERRRTRRGHQTKPEFRKINRRRGLPGYARLVIARDNDEDGALAAERLARRCAAARVAATVVVPASNDFNDDLVEFGAAALRARLAPLFRADAAP